MLPRWARNLGTELVEKEKSLGKKLVLNNPEFEQTCHKGTEFEIIGSHRLN